MGIDEASVSEKETVAEELIDEEETPTEDQVEISDPDDIDALLESMGIDEASVMNNNNEAVNKSVPKENKDDEGQSVVGENREKIENLTEEYVAPLLSADFSDILAKTSEKELNESELSQESEHSMDGDEDFDIDELIDSAGLPTEDSVEKEELDIGDDLVSEAFDEEMLAELLNDKESELAIELSPDFSDQNVLAGLLNDNDDDNDGQVSEASEINDIQELDNLNFDELLANIEEESSVVNQRADFNQTPDTNDEISLEDFDNFNPHASSSTSGDENSSDDEEDFVSVDSLLSASQDEVTLDEPYEKANIDVGLNEFPEFTHDVNPIDVDVDENGMAAKLDLAKVYLEIGDEDNAQVILKEIVKLGDHQQQSEAQDLLDGL